MTRLERFFFRDLLPGSISGDATIRAIADALDPLFASIIKSIPNLLIWHRLAVSAGRPVPDLLPPIARLVASARGLIPLSTRELELLAWQFHVDFREAARSDAELAAMVLDSIPWHRIKGTPAGIRAALELCGYSGITLEEDGTGAAWATWQIGLSGITGMDDLARIVAVCREMQPARCRLWRVYTPDYDFRPGVWSGPLPLCAWSNCWWSEYSGAETPDIPGLDDDTGLIVSFGARRGVLVSPLCRNLARAARRLTLNHGWQASLRRFPAWSECDWGDVFPRDHSFTFAHLYSFTWAEAVYEQYRWAGPWDERCWRGRLLRVDRRLPPWRFHVLGHPLTEAVWSGCEPDYTPTFRPDAPTVTTKEATDGDSNWLPQQSVNEAAVAIRKPADAGNGYRAAHGRVLSDVPGTWSALNFWGGAPRVEILPAPQVWSEDAWSEAALAPQETAILELVPCLRGEAVPALKPGQPLPAVTLHFPVSTAPLCPDAAPRWTGRWDTRRWRGHCGFFVVKFETTQRARKKRASKKREDL